MCNPKPDLHKINMHFKFGENPLIFKVIVLKRQIWMCRGLIHVNISKTDEICQLAIPNQISTISVRKSIDIYSSYRPQKKNQTCRGQKTVKNWRKLAIINPKPDLHNINAHIKFGENPLTFTQVIVRKRKCGRTYDRRTDGHADDQHETIIPRHYRVAEYKNHQAIKVEIVSS